MKPRRREKASNRRTPKRKPKPNPRPRLKRVKSAKAAKRVKRAKLAQRVSLDRKTALALEREVRRLRLARGRLERRLTATVQEIGMLRQFEIRARGLEAELARRDAEIEQLRRERDERLRETEIRIAGASSASTPP
jgi:DNA-binding XRE family transcriptional regulator